MEGQWAALQRTTGALAEPGIAGTAAEQTLSGLQPLIHMLKPLSYKVLVLICSEIKGIKKAAPEGAALFSYESTVNYLVSVMR